MAWTRTIFGLAGTTTLGPGTIQGTTLELTASTGQIVLDSDAANTGTVTMAALTADRTWTLPDATDTLVGKATTDTLTNKTLTSPVVGTQLTLDQATADYTLTWADPAAARAISIPDPLGTDVFVFRDMTQTLLNKTLTSPSIGGATITGAAPATPTANKLYTDSIVKGWVETSGAGAWTIDDDLNVSSITDNGVGDATINWATAFASANYAVVGMTSRAAADGIRFFSESTDSAKSTTAVRIILEDSAGALADPLTGISLIAIGDQ